MTTASFSLVEGRWLPVALAADFPDRDRRGPAPRVSLREAFAHGEHIVDLRCYPHERIALMRLLICIAQRALNGPETEEDWLGCRERLADEAVRYLEKNKGCFNLFGDGPRFLQAHGKGKPGDMTVFRLRFIDKNTPTLFDAHVQPGSATQAAKLAVSLVAYQSFAAGGKTGGSEPSPKGRKTKNGKVKMEPQGGKAGLCRDSAALHGFILGKNLLETVHWNLICTDRIAAPMTWNTDAKPIWEFREEQLEKLPESEIKADYLGRLCPLSRAVWVDDKLETAEVSNGISYGVFSDSKDQKTKKVKPGTAIREVSASIQPGKSANDKPRLVSASLGGGLPKAAWRELHAVAVLGYSAKRGGPLALEHLRTMNMAEVGLWCGAMVGAQAKVPDTIESVFRLPIAFLESADVAEVDDPLKCPGPNQTYRQGVKFAENWARKLRNAVFVYHLRLADDFTKKQNADRGRKIQHQAETQYWTALEQKADSVLLHDVAVNSARYWSSEQRWMARSPWGDEVIRAGRDAYDFACAHTTPRQLRAYAAGLKALYGEKRTKSASDENSEDSGSPDKEDS